MINDLEIAEWCQIRDPPPDIVLTKLMGREMTKMRSLYLDIIFLGINFNVIFCCNLGVLILLTTLSVWIRKFDDNDWKRSIEGLSGSLDFLRVGSRTEDESTARGARHPYYRVRTRPDRSAQRKKDTGEMAVYCRIERSAQIQQLDLGIDK